ncbi:putative tryptophanase leader peptide [Staphylococcus epidermidis VCU129]|nr:putative tryptophanase leader peptide [Staphylococcus epidermidis VCU129]
MPLGYVSFLIHE